MTILIRTGSRPAQFARCLQSIYAQTHPCKVIISIDTDWGYEGVDAIRVKRKQSVTHPWNLYCNELKEQVQDDWYMFLDDDDILDNPDAIAELIPHLTNPNEAVICRMKYRGNIIPKGEVKRGTVGMPCVILHSSRKDVHTFDGNRAADWRYVERVMQAMVVKVVPVVVARVDLKSNGK